MSYFLSLSEPENRANPFEGLEKGNAALSITIASCNNNRRTNIKFKDGFEIHNGFTEKGFQSEFDKMYKKLLFSLTDALAKTSAAIPGKITAMLTINDKFCETRTNIGLPGNPVKEWSLLFIPLLQMTVGTFYSFIEGVHSFSIETEIVIIWQTK